MRTSPRLVAALQHLHRQPRGSTPTASPSALRLRITPAPGWSCRQTTPPPKRRRPSGRASIAPADGEVVGPHRCLGGGHRSGRHPRAPTPWSSPARLRVPATADHHGAARGLCAARCSARATVTAAADAGTTTATRCTTPTRKRAAQYYRLYIGRGQQHQTDCQRRLIEPIC